MKREISRNLGLELFTHRAFYPLAYVTKLSTLIATILGCLPGLFVFIYAPDTVAYLGLLNLLSQIEAKDTILLAATLLATVGWITTVTTARYLSRRQHTINVLLQHRFNDEFHKHRSTIYACYPEGTSISKSDAEALFSAVKRQAQRKRKDSSPSLREVYTSLVIVLNYYEFLAVGISRCDLNERLMRAFYKSMVFAFCEKTHEFIKHAQSGQPSAFESLIELYKVWKRTDQFPLATCSNTINPTFG